MIKICPTKRIGTNYIRRSSTFCETLHFQEGHAVRAGKIFFACRNVSEYKSEEEDSEYLNATGPAIVKKKEKKRERKGGERGKRIDR